jgi:CDP-2,3-bis-(O-geranylgeranyl)-sn-glycerol synthase
VDVVVLGQALLLLLAANGAPILLARLLGSRWNCAVDGGQRFSDGRRVLGSAKSCRGVLAAVAACGVVAPLAGVPVMMGALFGALAMAGDLFSSFIKRRLGIPPSGRALGLDQIPESLVPLWLLRHELDLAPLEVLALSAAFMVIELWLSRLLFRWHIRNRPY